MQRKPAVPVVSFAGRISVDADRRKLEAKLDFGASKLIMRALQALAREIEAMEPAE